MQLSPLKRLYIAGIRDGRTFRAEHAVEKAEETGKRSLGHSTKRRAHAKRENKKSRHIGKAGVHVRIANLVSGTQGVSEPTSLSPPIDRSPRLLNEAMSKRYGDLSLNILQFQNYQSSCFNEETLSVTVQSIGERRYLPRHSLCVHILCTLI